jgi:hypothetical protein
MENFSKAAMSVPSSTRTAMGYIGAKKLMVSIGIRRQGRLYTGGRRRRNTHGANRDVLLASILEDLGNNTLFLELKVHLGLVRLDLDQNLTRGDGVAGLLLPGSNVAGLHCGRQSRHLDHLVAREGGIVANDVRGEARSQGLVSRREDTPPKSGAEHLGKMSLTMSRGERLGWWARCAVEGQMLTDGGVWSTIDA